MNHQKAIHYLVSGRVQGVWYRASAQKKAKKLGLKGWVRNLPDGRVEALACGEDEAIRQFEKWLWKGPIAAKVKEVQINVKVSDEVFSDFSVVD